MQLLNVRRVSKGTGLTNSFEYVWRMEVSTFTERQKFCCSCKKSGKVLENK